jgi:hypothetical protein
MLGIYLECFTYPKFNKEHYMAIDPKDPRLTDPKFQEFEDFVGLVLDKREAKRQAEESTRLQAEEANKKKVLFSFFPF